MYTQVHTAVTIPQADDAVWLRGWVRARGGLDSAGWEGKIPVRIDQIGIYIILAAIGEGGLAEDRVQWRAVVSSLSSLRVA